MPKLRHSRGLYDSRYYTEEEIDTMLSDGTISHLNLSDIGVNTHIQIDNHIADPTIHFTEASIDHTAILNIGVNTHVQIDTHIASTANPHSVTSVQVNLHPGIILSYGGAAAPTGWLLCNGASLLRATYDDLFTSIGVTFGSVDGTHFNVPDLRGIFQRGAGVNGTLDDAGGTGFTGVLGTYQNDKSQGHKHSLFTNIDGALGVNYLRDTSDHHGNILHRTYPNTISEATQASDGPIRAGNETNPANLGVTFIIKY